MSFEDELGRRFAARADETVADPDLAEVEASAGHRRTRRRRTVAVGTIAVTGLIVVGVMLAAGDRPESEDIASEVAASPTATSAEAPVATEAPADSMTDTATETPTETATDSVTDSTLPQADAVTDGTPSSGGSSSDGSLPAADDAAAPYVARTTEIYRREIGGREIVVRRSDVSWGEFFGLDWRAPTGSAEICMGEHVLLVRDTGSSLPLGQVWEPYELFVHDQPDLTVEQGMFGELAVVYTSGASTEVALLNGRGDEVDRAPLVDGLAMVVMAELWVDEIDPGEPSLVLVTDGVAGAPISLTDVAGARPDRWHAECTPQSFPTLPLPPAGEQPDDPAAAEAEIRARHALVVDRSVTLEEDPPGLVDDDTGIMEATAEVDAGPYADVAASAVHTINSVVFTAPDEAWFEYTITTSISEMPGRFGVARFNGEVWQINRATVCQDLAAAGGECTPRFEVNTPPEPTGWADLIAEHERTAQLYFEHQQCLPPPFDGGWCIEPEDVETGVSGSTEASDDG